MQLTPNVVGRKVVWGNISNMVYAVSQLKAISTARGTCIHSDSERWFENMWGTRSVGLAMSNNCYIKHRLLANQIAVFKDSMFCQLCNNFLSSQ